MKQRLDQILLQRNLAPDLDTARRLIGAGEVYVDESVFDKPGSRIPETAIIRLKKHCPFVSRGGFKLDKGIDTFQIKVEGKSCLDVGASSGGFTDCLLQHGAAKVFAVDVAYGQLAWKLRQDKRVEVIERFNARYLEKKDLHGTAIHLAVTDVSFISLTKILPAMVEIFTGPIEILALLKPQFELCKEDIGPRGVVTDATLHHKAINKIKTFIETYPKTIRASGIVESPIRGPKGNTEYLIHITS